MTITCTRDGTFQDLREEVQILILIYTINFLLPPRMQMIFSFLTFKYLIARQTTRFTRKA